jgi:hypothetical protein
MSSSRGLGVNASAVMEAIVIRVEKILIDPLLELLCFSNK